LKNHRKFMWRGSHLCQNISQSFGCG
jgi:hypothetical protein